MLNRMRQVPSTKFEFLRSSGFSLFPFRLTIFLVFVSLIHPLFLSTIFSIAKSNTLTQLFFFLFIIPILLSSCLQYILFSFYTLCKFSAQFYLILSQIHFQYSSSSSLNCSSSQIACKITSNLILPCLSSLNTTNLFQALRVLDSHQFLVLLSINLFQA